MESALLRFNVRINKNRIYKRLHFVENTESYKSIENCFNDICHIVRDNMKLTGAYFMVNDTAEISFKELKESANWSKYVLCFVSSKDEINSYVNDMISSGDYLKGYLLNEIATDVIFNASDELNKIIKKEVSMLGYKLTKMYAPGDDLLDLKHQQTILDALKKHVLIDAYLTESYMIIPQKSMLYLFGAEKCNDLHSYKSTAKEGLSTGVKEESCGNCSNLNCKYREVN